MKKANNPTSSESKSTNVKTSTPYAVRAFNPAHPHLKNAGGVP